MWACSWTPWRLSWSITCACIPFWHQRCSIHSFWSAGARSPFPSLGLGLSSSLHVISGTRWLTLRCRGCLSELPIRWCLAQSEWGTRDTPEFHLPIHPSEWASVPPCFRRIQTWTVRPCFRLNFLFLTMISSALLPHKSRLFHKTLSWWLLLLACSAFDWCRASLSSCAACKHSSVPPHFCLKP